MRGFLYALARWLGDGEAVAKNRVPQRIARRAIGRATGKALSRLLRF